MRTQAIYIVQATASHEEVSGTARFIHRRAWTDRAAAERFAPEFAKEIEADRSRPLTYCNVTAHVSQLELIDDGDD